MSTAILASGWPNESPLLGDSEKQAERQKDRHTGRQAKVYRATDTDHDAALIVVAAVDDLDGGVRGHEFSHGPGLTVCSVHVEKHRGVRHGGSGVNGKAIWWHHGTTAWAQNCLHCQHKGTGGQNRWVNLSEVWFKTCLTCLRSLSLKHRDS